jgi:opacity protein-like surface antigen
VRRAILSLTALLALLAASASPAFASGFDARIGGFFPRGRDCGIPSNQRAEYTLFQDVCTLYFAQPSDFDGVYGGVEFNQVLTSYVEVGVSYDYYSRTTDTSYRDYERPGGGDIFQSLRLRVAPLGLTVRLMPTSKKAKVVPYIGGGIDALFYKYEEYGDFIDFFDPDLAITPDHFVSESTAFGYHALGGLRFYVNRDFAIVAEGRYQWGKDDMGEDFAPNEPGLINTIDLSGWTATIGVHVRF